MPVCACEGLRACIHARERQSLTAIPCTQKAQNPNKHARNKTQTLQGSQNGIRSHHAPESSASSVEVRAAALQLLLQTVGLSRGALAIASYISLRRLCISSHVCRYIHILELVYAARYIFLNSCMPLDTYS